MENEQTILNNNTDKTVNNAYGTYRKPRSIFGYENLFLNDYYQPSFGSTIYYSLLNAFSNIFEWTGLPDEAQFTSDDLERFITGSGRVKIIKVGSKYYCVHITPQQWSYTGYVLKSWITEPYLGKLNGKQTEIFQNVEIRNNGVALSLLRQVYPYIDAIDDAMWNLSVHANMLNVVGYASNTTKGNDSNTELEASLNQQIIDGQPIKVFEVAMNGEKTSPFFPIGITDATPSFIAIVAFNWNKMLSSLHIPNNNVEGKDERLITGEIAIQNIVESAGLSNMLMEREKAVEELNNIFGWNISVDLKQEVKDMIAGKDEGDDANVNNDSVQE